MAQNYKTRRKEVSGPGISPDLYFTHDKMPPNFCISSTLFEQHGGGLNRQSLRHTPSLQSPEQPAWAPPSHGSWGRHRSSVSQDTPGPSPCCSFTAASLGTHLQAHLPLLLLTCSQPHPGREAQWCWQALVAAGPGGCLARTARSDWHSPRSQLEGMLAGSDPRSSSSAWPACQGTLVRPRKETIQLLQKIRAVE